MTSQIKLRLSVIFLAVGLVFAPVCGCTGLWQKKPTDAEAEQPSSPWLYKAKGTGIDPRAREIEKRLGYE